MRANIVIIFLAIIYSLSAQKPTITDVLNGQQKNAEAQDAVAAAAAKAADAAVRRSIALGVQAGINQERSRAQLASLTQSLKDLQDAKLAADKSDKEERQRVADAALASHADTIHIVKTFGGTALGLILGGWITVMVQGQSSKSHQKQNAKKLDTIEQLVDGEKTASMKVAVASLKAQLALTKKLSPESSEAIESLTGEILARDQELKDRAIYMEMAERRNAK